MALAQVTVWVPGQVLTAAAQNAEFQNILTNPISLISPTTGPINFNLQAHTNLVPSAVSASSGVAGQALIVSTAVTPSGIWGQMTPGAISSATASNQNALLMLATGATWGFVTPAGISISAGAVGNVLSMTSATALWQVIAPSGGLSTGIISTGALYYLSTAGALVPLTIGTSGQVLTVSTALLPSWAAAAGGGAAGTVRAAVVTVTSGNLALATVFTNLTPGLTITPATTAARLLLDVSGAVESSGGSTGNLVFTFTLDSSNLGGPTQGLWSIFPSVSLTSSEGSHTPINGSWLTSVVSTAAHTVNVQGLSEFTAGITRTVLRTTDPPLRVSAIEIATTG